MIKRPCGRYSTLSCLRLKDLMMGMISKYSGVKLEVWIWTSTNSLTKWRSLPLILLLINNKKKKEQNLMFHQLQIISYFGKQKHYYINHNLIPIQILLFSRVSSISIFTSILISSRIRCPTQVHCVPNKATLFSSPKLKKSKKKKKKKRNWSI